MTAVSTLQRALRRLGISRMGNRAAEVARLRGRVAELEQRVRRLRRRQRQLRSQAAGAAPQTTAVPEIPGLSRLELRRRCVLEGVPDSASILEIGPAHNAILPKRDGFNTKTVDYLDREGLIERYKDFKQYSPDDIEDVDYVLPPGAAMSEVIDERFDLVVASHVLEHTTSMIDFLNECARLLAPGGVLALVVPDHRYCFDRFRERSSIGRVIDASLNPPAVHTMGTVIEERLNATQHRGSTAWLPGHRGDYRFVNGLEQVISYGERALKAEEYIDTHNWVCTPHHLRLMLRDLHALGFITLREKSFHDTVRHEFFLSLSTDAPGPRESREQLVQLSENERRSLDAPTFEGLRPASSESGPIATGRAVTPRATTEPDAAIPLPPPELRLMGDSDERFVAVGVQLAELLYRLGLGDRDALLDVGCSVGRLPIGLLTATAFEGRYLGFDVTPKQVTWAHENLGARYANLEFRHIDVRNDRYNPKGTVEPRDVRFPADTSAFDMACLFSIFTHFYAEDIGLYLRELERVLRPGGHVVATWFLFDDDRYDAALTSTYPMVHRLDQHTIYNDAADPLRAIAFHVDKVRELVADAGLEISRVEYGTWAGGPGPEFQDVVVLSKPVPPGQARAADRSR